MKSKLPEKTFKKIYKIVGEEILDDRLDPACFAKALHNAKGDEAKMLSLYVKYRYNEMLETETKAQQNKDFYSSSVAGEISAVLMFAGAVVMLVWIIVNYTEKMV